MNRDCDWMIRKKREKSVCVHGSSVRTVKDFPVEVNFLADFYQLSKYYLFDLSGKHHVAREIFGTTHPRLLPQK